jgi:hypothetical protein
LKPISFHLVCIVWCIPWSQILQQRELHFCMYCWHASSDMTYDQKGWTSLTKYIYIYIPWLHWLWLLNTFHCSLKKLVKSILWIYKIDLWLLSS